MKLYSMDLSPYASAVRLAIYANSLPIDIISPPEGGTRSPAYLAINPIGKVPALVLDDGTVIPESVTILEYLADIFPAAGLLPAKPELAARARLLTRVGQVYAMTPASALFGQTNPATRDAKVVDGAFAEIEKGLDHLDHFLGDGPYAVGDSLTSADCALVPLCFFVNLMGSMFGKGDLIVSRPKFSAYWSRIRTEPVPAKVLGEMQEGLKVMQARMAAAPQPA